MNIRTVTRTLLLSIFAFLCSLQAAQAGLIIGDKEWMLRGTLGSYASHVAAAESDTDWTWAFGDDLLGSPLLAGGLTQADYEAFAPTTVCGSLQNIFCHGWLADDPIVFPMELRARFMFDQALPGWDLEDEIPDTQFSAPPQAGLGTPHFRVAYRPIPTSVPEPATLSLLGLALAGLGWTRLKRA